MGWAIQSDPIRLSQHSSGPARPSSLYRHSVRVLDLVEQSLEPLAGPQDVPTHGVGGGVGVARGDRGQNCFVLGHGQVSDLDVVVKPEQVHVRVQASERFADDLVLRAQGDEIVKSGVA